MASYDDGEREDDGPRRAVYAPLEGHKRRAQDDHPRDNDPGHKPHEPEPLEDLRLLEYRLGEKSLVRNALTPGPGS